MLNHRTGFFLLLELTHQEKETKQVHQLQFLENPVGLILYLGNKLD